ncbi:hypothetical protein B0H16DRAFT_1711902 [Mycena metata]|uniref:Uncharacterized protein n=1 Tax=Mycena metata TaxID=1033252 RepID=A0AAD7K538_9AGAR|nr:hypothetical protein B0H16DRAFT_1711902 [Mycena metata]
MPTAAITDAWVLVYVSERLLSPKFIWDKPTTLAMSHRRGSTPSLPPELWIYIHRLALSTLSPLAKIYASNDTIIRSGAKPDDPVNDRNLQLFLTAARSLRCVCRLWSELGLELLFENIWVNSTRRWPSLSSGLQHPNVAHLVRSIRLSTTRFDHNIDVLRRCLHVEVLVQPEFPRTERLYSVATVQLPPLQSLKRLYWIASAWSSALLQSVLFAAPNLEHISLSSSTTIGFDPATQPTFPDLPRLNSLVLAQLNTESVRAILRTDLSRLTRLTIDPAHLSWDAFPVLPALEMLALLDYSIQLPFPAIFACCPALRELRYDALCRFIPPEEKQRAPFLACIRLFLRRRMTLPTQAQAQAALLLEPAFSALERVILDGPGWGPLASNAPSSGAGGTAVMWPGLTDLLARGCRIEKGVE